MRLQPKHFRYNVEKLVIISKADIDLIIECGERHYDWRCKEAVRQGGFVWGWRNRVCMAFLANLTGEFDYSNVPAETADEISVTVRQADLICKILEIGCYLSLPGLRRAADELSAEFSALHKTITAEWNRVNSGCL